jgi:hypothetical protein
VDYWSTGVVQNKKSEEANLRVSGVGCQVSGVREEKQKT